MPFKIVQTQEKGTTKLSIVPSAWEAGGKLYWPPNNLKIGKLIKDDKSKPGPSWQAMPCILKRKNLFNYHDADMELMIMEECTDTDNAENARMEICSALEPPLPPPQINFESIAEHLVNTF